MPSAPVRKVGLGNPRMTEPEALLAGAEAGTVQPPDDVAPDDRPVLEAVAGATADQPDVVEVGVPIDHEMAVRRGLVLADPRLDHGRIGQVGEATRAR